MAVEITFKPNGEELCGRGGTYWDAMVDAIGQMRASAMHSKRTEWVWSTELQCNVSYLVGPEGDVLGMFCKRDAIPSYLEG